MEFEEDAIAFAIRYWIRFTNKRIEFLAKRDAGIKAFNQAGIVMLYPVKTVTIKEKDLIKTK